MNLSSKMAARLAALLPLTACELTQAENTVLIQAHMEELLQGISPLQAALIGTAIGLPEAASLDAIMHQYGASQRRILLERRLGLKHIAQVLCRLWLQQPPLPMDDTASMMPVLTDQWRRGAITPKVYRSLRNTLLRGYILPQTVGELRQMLREYHAPRLMRLPGISPRVVNQLRAVFLAEGQK